MPSTVPFSVTDIACGGAVGRTPLGEFRQAEIQQLHAALRDQNIGRLQIPMHNLLAMRGVERIAKREIDSSFAPSKLDAHVHSHDAWTGDLIGLGDAEVG